MTRLRATQRRFWTTERDDSKTWHARLRLGRLTVGWHVHRHRYPSSSDRWVFQPEVIYDRA